MTDAWVTGTHAELRQMMTLKQLFFRVVEPEGGGTMLHASENDSSYGSAGNRGVKSGGLR